ncbi:MAG: prepilin-type N-terminal cleavage/methylation domain-containing protein [Opitutaceae bacterium]|jgi:prepilin-type N-terminal cleavage/methylation domain-containing protein/prepilin-type processing-associated H-X9-DG protein|nr:prepilin-type N-terminal cleavage/methylation domain-containing protein [Opitutaceae bacterium]
MSPRRNYNTIRSVFPAVLHPAARPGKRRTRRAFTLVELLVVIAIIGILAGIIIPVAGRTRDTARSAQCLTHLRTLATAHALYRNEFRGDSPPGTANPDHPLSEGHNTEGIRLLRRYYKPGPNYIFTKSPTTFIIEKTELCPMSVSTNTRANSANPERGPDYGMLARDEKYDTFYEIPSRTPLFWDGWNAIWNSSRRMPPRHGGGSGINVAFLDGHAACLPGSDQRLYSEWWSNAMTKSQPDDSKLGAGEFLLSKTRP